MDRRFIHAFIAGGVSALITGLVLIGLISSAVLKDAVFMWPQVGMVIAAFVIIFLVVYYLYPQPQTVESVQFSINPRFTLTLVIDSINDKEPQFHIDVENMEGSAVTVLWYSFKTPTFKKAVSFPPQIRPVIPSAGQLTLLGHVHFGITQFPTSLDVTLTYETPDGPQIVFKSSYRFFIGHAVSPSDRFSPINWDESESVSPAQAENENDFVEEFQKPSGAIDLVYYEKTPNGAQISFDLKTQYRRLTVTPIIGKVKFLSTFGPSLEGKSIETLFAFSDKAHVLLVAWDDAKRTISLAVDGREVEK